MQKTAYIAAPFELSLNMTRTLSFVMILLTAASMAVVNGVSAQTTDQVNNGSFYGKVVDNESGKAVEAVTVQLLQNRYDTLTGKKKELVLATQLSDKKGEFHFSNLPLAGSFRLRISAMGYKLLETKIAFDASNKTDGHSSKDLGNIKISIDPEELQNVVVNARKPLLQLFLDKKVYNVEKDISVTGGTATDIARNIPGLIVDIDGNITMRNASPQIFIDGRPTTLSLDQVPADHVASVEIMTNPSARYDASGGGAGIINIILKKARQAGYNGNLRAGIDSRLRPNIGGDINVKRRKVNFFTAAQFSLRKNMAEFTTHRTDFPAVGKTAITQQDNNPVNRGYFGFGRAGIDFLLTNRTTLTFSGNYMRGNIKVQDRLEIDKDTITGLLSISETSTRDLRADIDYSNVGAGMSLKHNFAKAGKEWTADFNFNRNHNRNTSDYSSRFFDGNGNEKPYQGAERATGGGSTNFYTFQTDFINPLAETKKLETGLRMVIRDYGSWNDNFRQMPPSTVYMPLPTTAIKFDFNDIVYAAYGSYSSQLSKSFHYQLGLRMEGSEYKGNLISKNQRFSNRFPLSLFPSVFASQKINDKEDLQFSYSRKVNRPAFFQLLPFVDFSDSLNLSVGNPDLKPEFTHLADISYNNQFSAHHSLLTTLYGRYSKNLITRYQYKTPNTDPAKPDSVIFNSYANASNSYTIGLELTARNKITNWWDITTNINAFNVRLNAGNIAGTNDSERFSWFAKMNQSFKIPHGFTLQLTGDYQAKTILPSNSGRASGSGFGGGMYGFTQNLAQGFIKPIYGVDIALRKDLFKNNTASITLQVNDIFRTRTFETHANTAFFTQDNYRLRDPQVFRLNFNWRFGKLDADLNKRKNKRTDTEVQIQQVGGQ